MNSSAVKLVFFFFQAEDGIRDFHVTGVQTCALPISDLPAAVARALEVRGAQRVVVPPDLPIEWRPSGPQMLVDGELADEVLDAADGVLTGCALGIAETGTIVLDGGARQGRRAITLLP